MKRIISSAAVVVGLAVAAVATSSQSPTRISVVRDASCGCCMNWVAHLEKAGFKATVTESSDMDGVKDKQRVPQAARSCHTATVGGYVVEGHVPAADIQRLLKERPNVVGIAVPGMPVGSPGMESSSGRVQPYDVLTFDKTGRTTVFASHGR